MKRFAAALAFALFTAAAASAQSYPDDPGLGTERGVEQVNNSGQVGTVTLFRRGANSSVVVDLKGTEPGRAQSVRIYRGKSCEEFTPGPPAYFLNDMRNGRSVSSVKAPEDKLLSGNYNVVVFSSNKAGAPATACGHLYA
jgi:hypothetical protein